MQRASISQLRAFVRITATIDGDCVSLRERGPMSSYQSKVPLTEIPDHPVEYRNVPRGWVFATIAFALMFAHALTVYLRSPETATIEPAMWMGLFVLAAGFNVWGKSARCIGYACASGNLFLFDLPGKRSPRPFLEQIQRAKDAHLAALYTRQVRLRGERLIEEGMAQGLAAAPAERTH